MPFLTALELCVPAIFLRDFDLQKSTEALALAINLRSLKLEWTYSEPMRDSLVLQIFEHCIWPPLEVLYLRRVDEAGHVEKWHLQDEIEHYTAPGDLVEKLFRRHSKIRDLYLHNILLADWEQDEEPCIYDENFCSPALEPLRDMLLHVELDHLLVILDTFKRFHGWPDHVRELSADIEVLGKKFGRRDRYAESAHDNIHRSYDFGEWLMKPQSRFVDLNE